MTRDTITRTGEPATAASDTTEPPARTAAPGPGTRGHASAAREQERAHDPSPGVHPLVVAALVAVVAAVVLAWQPFRAEPAATAAVTSNVLDVGALQQEKEALTAVAATRRPTWSNTDAATLQVTEKAAMDARPSRSTSTNAAEATRLAGEKDARAARTGSVAVVDTLAEEKRQLLDRGE